MNRNRQRNSWNAVGGAGLLAALPLFAFPAFADSMPSDAWITTKVKLTLLTTDALTLPSVNVDTVGRRVTLHGIVAVAAEREAAERAAKSVHGVESVRNLLQVVPRDRVKATVQSDDDIAQQVGVALRHEDSLTDSDITVQSVHNGVVLLKGSATDLTDRLTAVQVARRIPGVHRVASEIVGPDTLTDSDLRRESLAAAAPGLEAAASGTDGGRGAGPGAVATRPAAAYGSAGAAHDLFLTAMVKARLLADRRTPALDINVDTAAGAVTLFGIVGTTEARDAAEEDARAVGQVRSVVNKLQVVAGSLQPLVEANDSDIERYLRRNLEDHMALRSIEIDVKNCVARLTGTVPTVIDRVEAMQVARATRGVCSVEDELRLPE